MFPIIPPMGLGRPKPIPAVFVASTTVANPDIDNTITLNKPAGTAEGDLLIFLLLGDGGNPVELSTRPSGFVDKHSTTDNMWDSAFASFHCDVKIAGVGEPASYTWNPVGGAGEHLAALLTYRPAHETQMDVIVGAVMGNPSTTHTAPNATPLHTETVMLAAYMLNRQGANALAISAAPTGMTQRALINGAGGPVNRQDLTLAVYEDDTIIAPAGLYTGKSMTVDNTAFGFGITLGIRALNAN